MVKIIPIISFLSQEHANYYFINTTFFLYSKLFNNQIFLSTAINTKIFTWWLSIPLPQSPSSTLSKPHIEYNYDFQNIKYNTFFKHPKHYKSYQILTSSWSTANKSHIHIHQLGKHFHISWHFLAFLGTPLITQQHM